MSEQFFITSKITVLIKYSLSIKYCKHLIVNCLNDSDIYLFLIVTNIGGRIIIIFNISKRLFFIREDQIDSDPSYIYNKLEEVIIIESLSIGIQI